MENSKIRGGMVYAKCMKVLWQLNSRGGGGLTAIKRGVVHCTCMKLGKIVDFLMLTVVLLTQSAQSSVSEASPLGRKVHRS